MACINWSVGSHKGIYYTISDSTNLLLVWKINMKHLLITAGIDWADEFNCYMLYSLMSNGKFFVTRQRVILKNGNVVAVKTRNFPYSESGELKLILAPTSL